MFKNLFVYWTTSIDTPSILFKINIWSFVNLRLFKFKISYILNYFILGLSNLEIRTLRFFYKDFNFDFILSYLIYLIFSIIIFSYFLI